MPLPPLATVEDATVYGYALPEANADTWLARASVRMRRAAGFQITSATSTVALAVDDGEVRLPSPPVTDVASVSRVLEDGSLQLLTRGRDWVWDSAETITLRTLHTWIRTASVDYTHGFLTVPDELIELVCSVAMRLSNTPIGMEAGVRSVTIDDYSRTFAAEARDDAAVLLPGEAKALGQILAVPSIYLLKST